MTLLKTNHPYVGGALIAAPSATEVINPATGLPVGSVGLADLALAGQALAAAQRAFPGWSQLPAAERAAWMDRLRAAVMADEEQLRLCVHHEMGKPWGATADDFQMLVDSLRYYAQKIRELRPEQLHGSDERYEHLLVRQPIGVVGAFLAWNFPLLNLAYKLGPALAAGCPIVIKPSTKTPLSAYRVGELCAAIGLPAGVVNILCGDSAKVSDAISASPIPQMLTLIGSTATGVHVMRTGATSIKRYSMELGGNAPVLVFADADLDAAADTICALKFGNSGQICVAPNRVFAEAAIAAALGEKLLARARAVRVGFDREADIQMGPVIDGGAWRRIDALVHEAVEHGAELLHGGGHPAGLEHGHFYAPTVLRGVTPAMRIAREEVFGPVVSLMTPFEDEDAVLQLANDTDVGLTAYVFTADAERASRCAAALQFGEVQINGVKYSIELPHCGVKQSGIGVDCSELALDEYLTPKRITRAKPITQAST